VEPCCLTKLWGKDTGTSDGGGQDQGGKEPPKGVLGKHWLVRPTITGASRMQKAGVTPWEKSEDDDEKVLETGRLFVRG